ncbi:MAG: hypothetical protein C5S48_03670 [Candidatus Methanogaster sp.]|nr:MAG: hypothetical protein C5S48_03670 [ANME-2 cluster archaeon]
MITSLSFNRSIVAAPMGSEPVGRAYKILFKDRFEDLLNCHLNNLVLDSRDTERYFLAIWLWDIDTQDWLGFVLLCFESCHRICDIHVQLLRVMRSIAEGILLLLLRQFREIYLSLAHLLHSFRKSSVSKCANGVNLHVGSSLALMAIAIRTFRVYTALLQAPPGGQFLLDFL